MNSKIKEKLKSCMGIINDIHVLTSQMQDVGNMTPDQVANYLLGLETIYQVKFDQLLDIIDSDNEIESDSDLIQVLTERDNYHEWADSLADAIASHFDVDIGEHSNMNSPWANALAIIDNQSVEWNDCSTNDFPPGVELDIKMGDGSVLCGVLLQSDGDLWWDGSGTGEKFIDPKYTSVIHWRIHNLKD